MTQPIDREGTFRADIIGYGLKEQESGSVAVTLQAALLEEWNGEGWNDWKDYQMEAYGDIWIVKKDGTLNNRQVEALVKHCGWDGNFASIVDQKWEPTACQVDIQADTYKEETRYKISWVNSYDRKPGALSMIDTEKAKQLQQRYGSDLRAIAGNVKLNGGKLAGKPASPKPNKKQPQPVGAEVGAEENPEDCPF